MVFLVIFLSSVSYFSGRKVERDKVTCYFVGRIMIETFYLHLEFTGKNEWSINLPFLCTKCGVCCTLEDFLTAGEINAKMHPEVQVKVKAIYEMLGKIWEADEAKYDDYIIHNPCPFLVDKSCSIYDIRPDGCRLFPKTMFGMLTQDCEPLNRFKRMSSALKKSRACKENYYFTGKNPEIAECNELIKPSKFNEKQYQKCIVKLGHAGITDEEFALFNYFNGRR